MGRSRAEIVVVALLVGATLAAVGFIVAYVAGNDNQLLGGSLGLAFGLLAAALIVASYTLLPQTEEVEERPDFARPESERASSEAAPRSATEVDGAARTLRDGADPITRRRLVVVAGGAAGTALGAAMIAPAASLGPAPGDVLAPSPWFRGRRLLDETDRPISVEGFEIGNFLTAFPEGADPRDLASPVVVVRVDPAQLELPPERSDWAPEGIMGFSKICTHAGCAINLFRSPRFPPTSPGPALVCPCHYSTFDVLRGGTVEFGPAGRPLPQLPLAVDRQGMLVAGGDYSEEVGPAWRGIGP